MRVEKKQASCRNGETIGKKDNLGIALGNKIDQNRLEIKSEIQALMNDFKSHFDKRLFEIRINEIIWKDSIISKLRKKHNVNVMEVVEVLKNNPKFRL